MAGSTVDLSNYSVSVGDSVECTASVSDSTWRFCDEFFLYTLKVVPNRLLRVVLSVLRD